VGFFAGIVVACFIVPAVFALVIMFQALGLTLPPKVLKLPYAMLWPLGFVLIAFGVSMHIRRPLHPKGSVVFGCGLGAFAYQYIAFFFAALAGW
jgi:hypothetical protein